VVVFCEWRAGRTQRQPGRGVRGWAGRAPSAQTMRDRRRDGQTRGPDAGRNMQTLFNDLGMATNTTARSTTMCRSRARNRL